jgi:hypothetical protein
MTPWLVHELRNLGFEVVCLDAWHARAALKMQINKTDQNDAEGLAQIVSSGFCDQRTLPGDRLAYLGWPIYLRVELPLRLWRFHRRPAPEAEIVGAPSLKVIVTGTIAPLGGQRIVGDQVTTLLLVTPHGTDATPVSCLGGLVVGGPAKAGVSATRARLASMTQ